MAGGVAGAGQLDLHAMLEIVRKAKQGNSAENSLAEVEAMLAGAAESCAQAAVAHQPPEEEEPPSGDIPMVWEEVAEHELAGLDDAGQVAVYKAREKQNKAREKERAEREKEKAAKMQKTKGGVKGSIHK